MMQGADYPSRRVCPSLAKPRPAVRADRREGEDSRGLAQECDGFSRDIAFLDSRFGEAFERAGVVPLQGWGYQVSSIKY